MEIFPPLGPKTHVLLIFASLLDTTLSCIKVASYIIQVFF